MTRPQSEAEYLATLLSAPVSGIWRPSLLLGTLSAGAVGLAGCGSGSGGGSGSGSGEVTYYPWVVQYRKSVFTKHGYTVPKTFDELKALAAKMQKDGLVPFAMADKDGWEAMGLFDVLNMRQNGYPFHIGLMSSKQDWSQKKVQDVFDVWRGLLPLRQPDAMGRTWQEAARSLQKGQTGMYYLATFMAQQFAAGAEQDDLDFFVFPEIDSTIGSGAIEAPTDGYVLSKRPKNEKGAKTFLPYLGSAEAQMTNVQAHPSAIAVSEKAETSKYRGPHRDPRFPGHHGPAVAVPVAVRGARLAAQLPVHRSARLPELRRVHLLQLHQGVGGGCLRPQVHQLRDHHDPGGRPRPVPVLHGGIRDRPVQLEVQHRDAGVVPGRQPAATPGAVDPGVQDVPEDRGAVLAQ
ncbi:ABC transporter substrate-binding protein [Luteococcus peritonei]|uniref:ABC transporter substrate-binding protein n=1 Tax=Luteococcus peritonei TaxID=88874 RepID=A0ABW4RWV5_9ACTN